MFSPCVCARTGNGVKIIIEIQDFVVHIVDI